MLEELRIVEIGQVLSAPYAGMILADLGAEVIKVEKPNTGDDARNMGPAFRQGASMTFHDVNRGKRSVVIDLKNPAGISQLLSLLERTDVLIHNLRPGEVAKLGIDATTLGQRYPRLIYCEISAFGHKGPRSLQPGYEPLLQAFGGLMSMNGHAEDAPSRMGASVVDQGAAMWAVIGILAALNRRQTTGFGSVVNTSLLETAIGWAASRAQEYLNQGRTSERYGTAHPNLVPYQAFDVADGQVMICAGNDRLFAKLAHALEQPHWVVDERFARNRDRLRNRELLVQLIQDLVRWRSRGDLIEQLERAGVPVAAVNTIAEMVAEPQVTALDIIRPVADEGFVLAGLPISFDGIRPVVSRTAPSLGVANAQYIGLQGCAETMT